MKKGLKITLIVLASFLFLILVGPFLIPISPARNTQPAKALADPDSQFIEINNLDVHYKQKGTGEPVFILSHGFGASTFSWEQVMEPLSDYGTVIAYDRPAFGLTERPLSWEGENPYTQESNIALLLEFMDAKGIQEAIIVGHSAGGTLATAFTIEHPDRVQALIEVAAAVYYTTPESGFYNWLIHTPQMDRIGPLILRAVKNLGGESALENAFYDAPDLEANPEIYEGYIRPFMVDNWDRAFWDYVQSASPADLAGRLAQIEVPTLVISGDRDDFVPLENSRQLAEDIPNATLTVLDDTSHIPQEESPAAFMVAVEDFLKTLDIGEQ